MSHKNNFPNRSGNRSIHKNNSPSRSGNRSIHKNNYHSRSVNRSIHKNNFPSRSGNRSTHKNNSFCRSANRSWHKNNFLCRSGNRSWHKNNFLCRSGNRSFAIFATKIINPGRYKSIIETPQSKKIATCCVNRPSPPFHIHFAPTVKGRGRAYTRASTQINSSNQVPEGVSREFPLPRTFTQLL